MIDTSGLPFAKPARKEKAETRQRTGHQSFMEKAIALSGKIVTHEAACFRCGSKKVVDPHHIVKRGYKKTAALIENQIPLCRYDCHRWAEDYPEAFQEWIDETLPGRRAEMEAINRQSGKPDWFETYENLCKVYYGKLKDKAAEEANG